MKLYSSDNATLMDVSRIYRRGNELIIDGVILESMPIQAKLKPAEVRVALSLMSVGTILFLLTMIFRNSR